MYTLPDEAKPVLDVRVRVVTELECEPFSVVVVTSSSCVIK